MKFLLDTHSFIWWDDEPGRLSPTVLSLCQDKENQMVLSVISAWEIQLKMSLGKLTIRKPLKEVIEQQQQDNNLILLPLTLTHVLALDGLPFHHKDPFDRMLIAQAKAENLSLISHDPMMKPYSIPVIW